MLPILVQAAQVMDEVYWMQAYGNRDSLLAMVGDSQARRFVEINYGPWDRLAGDAPFLQGVGARPPACSSIPRA